MNEGLQKDLNTGCFISYIQGPMKVNKLFNSIVTFKYEGKTLEVLQTQIHIKK